MSGDALEILATGPLATVQDLGFYRGLPPSGSARRAPPTARPCVSPTVSSATRKAPPPSRPPSADSPYAPCAR